MFFSSEDTPNNGPLISSRLSFWGGGGRGLGRGRVRDFEGDHVVFTKGDYSSPTESKLLPPSRLLLTTGP